MLDRIPHLQQFSRLYWDQMGDEVYGTIQNAFRQLLADAARLPDAGRSLRRTLYGELMLILDNPEYAEWVQLGLCDVETGNAVGGRFISPEQVGSLIAILDEGFAPDA